MEGIGNDRFDLYMIMQWGKDISAKHKNSEQTCWIIQGGSLEILVFSHFNTTQYWFD